jgi:hypothetical protein
LIAIDDAPFSDIGHGELIVFDRSGHGNCSYFRVDFDICEKLFEALTKIWLLRHKVIGPFEGALRSVAWGFDNDELKTDVGSANIAKERTGWFELLFGGFSEDFLFFGEDKGLGEDACDDCADSDSDFDCNLLCHERNE